MYWSSRRVKERRSLPFADATKSAANAALDLAASKVSRLVGHYPDYHDRAEVTISRLCEPELVAHEDDWEGVLKHGSDHETRQLGVDESVTWAQYFCVETLWGEYFCVETLPRVVRAP